MKDVGMLLAQRMGADVLKSHAQGADFRFRGVSQFHFRFIFIRLVPLFDLMVAPVPQGEYAQSR